MDEPFISKETAPSKIEMIMKTVFRAFEHLVTLKDNFIETTFNISDQISRIPERLKDLYVDVRYGF